MKSGEEISGKCRQSDVFGVSETANEMASWYLRIRSFFCISIISQNKKGKKKWISNTQKNRGESNFRSEVPRDWSKNGIIDVFH